MSNVRSAEREHARLLGLGLRLVSGPGQSHGAERAIPERDWLRLCLELVSRCDYLVACAGWERSHGCRCEVRHARLRRTPVFDANLSPLSIRPGPALLRNWRVRGLYDEDCIELYRRADHATAYIGDRTVACDGVLTDAEARQMAYAARIVWACGLHSVMEALS